MTTAFAAFTLSSPAAQAAAPFMIGHAFRKGDVPTGSFVTTDLTNFAVVPLRTWSDGSLKHAAIVGRVALSANTPVQVNLAVSTTAPAAGTILTAASIQTAAPTASIDCGSFGSRTLTSLLASPKRTFISTKEMVECHYSGAIGSDPTLYANFYVRLFADGTMWVRVAVGNGYMDTATANKTYVPTVTIGGVMAYNNGGVPYLHYNKQRYDITGWIGTDPKVSIRHDTGYLNRTKLVPNYWKGSPSQSELDRWVAATNPMSIGGASFTAVNEYTPGNNCNFTPYMPDQGYQEQLGILPNWDAQYCTSGAHPNLYRAVINNARAFNSYGTIYVDSVNRDPIRITQFPNSAGDGVGGSGSIPQTVRQAAIGTDGLVWESAHSPSAGYLAYIITADYYFLETCAFSANAYWLQESTAHGSGTSRFLNAQNRGRAWTYRGLGQFCSIYPDSMETAFGDIRLWMKSLVSAAYATYVTPPTPLPSPFLGYENLFDSRNYDPNPTFNGLTLGGERTFGTAPWEHHFTTQAVAMVTDGEPLAQADMPKLVGLRDYVLGAPVWINGGTGATEYNGSYAAPYTISIPCTKVTDGVFNTAPMSDVAVCTPGDIYRASNKRPYTCFPGSADNTQFLTVLSERQIDAAVYSPATLSSPITLTYHTDSGNGYITGFPNVPVTQIDGTTVTTIPAGSPVPYVRYSIMQFSGIRVSLDRYQGLPDNNSVYTITANAPPVSDGSNPGTHTLIGYSGGNPKTSHGYYANMLPALAYAVDGGKAGAVQAFSNFTTASNFSDQAVDANYSDTPTFGIVPRSYSQPAIMFTPSGVTATPAPTPAPVAGQTSLNIGHTVREYTTDLIAGCVVEGDRGLGVLGFEVPSTGGNGASIIYNDLSFPADSNKQYMARLVSKSGLGSFFLYEDGSYNADASGSFIYELFEDGVSKGTATATATVSNPSTADTVKPIMTGVVTASAVTSNSFTLAWQAASDNVSVTGYQVSIDGGNTYTNVGNVLTISESGLAATTVYQIRVRSYDGSGNFSDPLTLSVTTTSTTYIPPSTGSRTITVDFTDAFGQPVGNLVGFGYSVYAGKTADALGALIASGSGVSIVNNLLTLTVATNLPAGTAVLLVLSNTNGVVSQSPPCRSFFAPVSLQ